MNKVLIGVILTAVVMLGGAIMMSESDTDASNSTAVTFAAVQDDITSGSHFYDVRTPQEFSASRFEGAENFPLQAIQAGELPDIAKDAKIYVHCQSGNRSAQATQLLKKAGYSNVIDLGGLGEVKAIGGKLVS